MFVILIFSMKNRFFAVAFIFYLLLGSRAWAMSSDNFQIPWDSVNSGGDDVSESTNYKVIDTLGESVAGAGDSASYKLTAGYRAGDSVALSFTLRAANPSTGAAYTAFDSVTKTVTLSSASGYSVNDYIAVVENRGFSQLIAVGRIVGITGDVLTVDGFAGEPSSLSVSPAGDDDLVYRLNLNAVAFGNVSTGSEHVAAAMVSASTNAAAGLSTYLQADQELRSTAGDIMDAVTDGSVTVGSEEYGAEQVGSTAVNAGVDLGVTTTQRVIQTTSAPSGAVADRVGINMKLSIAATTPSGTYSQNVFFTVTANY